MSYFDDCYAITRIGPDRIAALTCSAMELVTLDLATGRAARLAGRLRHAHALSERGGRYYLRDRESLRDASGGRFVHFGTDEAWLETLG